MTGDLTQSDGERVWLNSIRNAFMVMASIAVHVSAMFMLAADNDDDFESNTTVAQNQTIHDRHHLGAGLLFNL